MIAALFVAFYHDFVEEKGIITWVFSSKSTTPQLTFSTFSVAHFRFSPPYFSTTFNMLRYLLPSCFVIAATIASPIDIRDAKDHESALVGFNREYLMKTKHPQN